MLDCDDQTFQMNVSSATFFSTMRNENVMKLEFLSSFQIAVRPVPWGQNFSEAEIEFLHLFPEMFAVIIICIIKKRISKTSWIFISILMQLYEKFDPIIDFQSLWIILDW